MNQPEFFPVAAAPEHREPTATKAKRIEYVRCGDCGWDAHCVDAAAEMKAHKAESERCK